MDKSVIILVVSREILEGAVLDRNAAFISNRVDDLGYRVRTIQVVDRVEGEMVAAMRWAIEQKPTFVLVTGGMGPSFDDNSRACVAKATGLPLREDPKALEYVRNSYQRLFAKGIVEDAEMTEERRRMAHVPAGAACYENPIGTGPAVQLAVGGTTVFLLPGVPAEMQRLFLLYVVPAMTATGPNTVRHHRQIDCNGSDESAISGVLRTVARHHTQVSFRTRVMGSNETRTIRIELVAEHADPVTLQDLLDRAEAEVRQTLGIEIPGSPTDVGRLTE